MNDRLLIFSLFLHPSIQPSQLEHLCINLCAETMQHFFNTHIFKSSIESCREEGIQCELEPDYVDNVPCIDLISSLVGPPLITRINPDINHLTSISEPAC